MDTSRIRALAAGARAALRSEAAARLERVLAPGSPERLERPAEVAELERSVAERGRGEVAEAAAYTWFNRLCALRYMDARGHTPAGVVSPAPGATEPEVLACARRGAFPPGLGATAAVRDRAGELLRAGASEAAYRELLLAACRRYAGPMPYLFGDGAASPLLAPGNLLAPGSVRARIVEGMDGASCAEGVEVVGWLYQFYVAERKDEFFQSGRKAAASDIAPATQLFTPGWIVRYLVENSLGRLWMQNNPRSALAGRMEYYLPPEPGEPYLHIDGPEEIRFLDPACGSGHILVYAFELLCEMYEEEGWPAREVPALVLKNNLWGLEVDPRAAELASFALEMCALERDPGFLDRGVDAHVAALEPVGFAPGELDRAGAAGPGPEALDALAHLDEVGSLWAPAPGEAAALRAAADTVRGAQGLLGDETAARLGRAADQAGLLSQRFHVVCANPPYMGSGKFNPWLSSWVRRSYPDEKGDLCCCFVRRGLGFAEDGGYVAMVTMQSWMFLGSYERMRGRLLAGARVRSMAHLGAHAFDAIGGEVVQTTAFALQKGAAAGEGDYVRLVDVPGGEAKAAALRRAVSDPACPWRHRADQRSFAAIPGSPIAYWAGEGMLRAFREGTPLRELAHPSAGITTGDNARFIRLWWEVGLESIDFDGSAVTDEAGPTTWYPCNKGGRFRKWYGNRENVMRFDAASRREMESCPGYRPVNLDRQFKESITWTDITSGDNSFRYSPAGTMFDHKGMEMFPPDNQLSIVLGFTNSSVSKAMLKILCPTLSSNAGEVGRLPYIAPAPADAERVAALVRENVAICREDWDSFETSWGFERHPLCLPGEPLVERQFERWEAECEARFRRLKANEEELNRIFAAAYGMEGEVPVEVPPDKVSVRRADLARDVKSLVSYGVGCVFGRYSIDAPGLVLADAGSTLDDFREHVPGATFLPDGTGIVPVTAGEWFGDDLASSLTRWLAAAYGEGALAENLAFIERALGKTLRAYLFEDFFRDHCAAYAVSGSGRRPIYWLVRDPSARRPSAARGDATFQCLVYAHRWDAGTAGDVLTGYLRPYMDKLGAAAAALEASGSQADRARAERFRAELERLGAWERAAVYPLAHERPELDLDDGVRANRERLAAILAKA